MWTIFLPDDPTIDAAELSHVCRLRASAMKTLSFTEKRLIVYAALEVAPNSEQIGHVQMGALVHVHA